MSYAGHTTISLNIQLIYRKNAQFMQPIKGKCSADYPDPGKEVNQVGKSRIYFPEAVVLQIKIFHPKAKKTKKNKRTKKKTPRINYFALF